MKAITDSTAVADVMQASTPVVVKFEARWCQPCKAMTPTLEAIEKELEGKVTFFKADVEHCPSATQLFKVGQVPTLVAIKDGVVTSLKTGAAPKQEILKWLDLALPGARD
ncbi:thioredoxin family protein [Bradyrhizobium sp. SZCCHNR3118]|uniref:thioredoxin family protein n=1 Tax=Bradyrhizobium sp. SZCCHNR3118 TaxID=3057468 RepID=UPI002915F648|nr:thioredoxin family protein [Bradyrhizobium sp. SZCCHNR3118]